MRISTTFALYVLGLHLHAGSIHAATVTQPLSNTLIVYRNVQILERTIPCKLACLTLYLKLMSTKQVVRFFTCPQ